MKNFCSLKDWKAKSHTGRIMSANHISDREVKVYIKKSENSIIGKQTAQFKNG